MQNNVMLNALHTHLYIYVQSIIIYIRTRDNIYVEEPILIVSPLQHPTTKHMRAQLLQFTPLAAPQPAPLQHGPA